MKYSLLLISFFPCMVISAQSKKQNQVATAVQELKQAMISGNKAELERIVANELSYGHSGGTIENKTQFVDKIVSGRSDFLSIELTDQTISVLNKTAVVRHNLEAKTNDNGKPGEVKLRVLLIFQKRGGQWKLIARQAVKPS
jgi:ketosteroid isomerase-like protein